MTAGGIILPSEASALPEIKEFAPSIAEIEGEGSAPVVRGPWQPQGTPEPAAPASSDEAIKSMALSWREYSEWRRTKCPPPEYRGAIWLDELDQSIHELIGEIGELAHLLTKNGPFFMANDPEVAKLRKKLIDGIGDVIFTASWVFDNIDPSFFGTRGRIVEGFLSDEERQVMVELHGEVRQLNLSPGMLNHFHKCPEEVQSVVTFWVSQINSTMLAMFANAALVSNRFKKVRWHRVKDGSGNPFYEQAENLFMICVTLDAICTLVGIDMLTAARRNMLKLDSRFPNGWVPGGGKR